MASAATQFAPNWDFIGNAVKKALRKLDLVRCSCLTRSWGEKFMPQPRLLLIDDEPALADFLANAAKSCGFEPVITAEDQEFRDAFIAERPEMVALDLGMPGM